jgi:TPR repeat protein
VPNEAMSICASISDDAMISKARVYFRPETERYYSYADMVFSGLNYCATLPAPRQDKTRGLQYYIQAVDDGYNTQRSSTFNVAVQESELCGFPPLERDPEKANAITVYATHPKQGNKLDDKFVRTGVSFVPAKKQ